MELSIMMNRGVDMTIRGRVCSSGVCFTLVGEHSNLYVYGGREEFCAYVSSTSPVVNFNRGGLMATVKLLRDSKLNPAKVLKVLGELLHEVQNEYEAFQKLLVAIRKVSEGGNTLGLCTAHIQLTPLGLRQLRDGVPDFIRNEPRVGAELNSVA